jgi:hypothetical protein
MMAGSSTGVLWCGGDGENSVWGDDEKKNSDDCSDDENNVWGVDKKRNSYGDDAEISRDRERNRG